MNIYETRAIVEEHCQVHLEGLPFVPGTEVEVVITPSNNLQQATVANRAELLFAALDRAGNTEPIGPLRREELYDRKVLR